MEKIFKITTLIHRYLMGNADAKEMMEVEQWLAEDSRHQEMMREFHRCDWKRRQALEYDVFDKEQEYRRFLKSKRSFDRRRAIWRYSSVAALVLLSLGIVLFSLLRENTDGMSQREPVTQTVSAGSSKAMLVLGNGEVVMLNDSLKLELDEQVARIKVDGARLCYEQSKQGSQAIVSEPALNTVITPRGGEYKLTLADGTRVWLNAESELCFPSGFVGKERVVHMKGEAYFEVAKDSLHPFFIHTDKAVIRVLGTSFNVNAYPEENQATTLVEGCVAIYCNGKVENLLPCEQWVFNEDGGEVRKIDPRFSLSWKNGNFAFEEQTLAEVFKELERWYDVSFQAEDRQLSNLKFTGVFPRYADFCRVLEIIELTTCLRCQLDCQTVVVKDEQK